MQFIETTGTHDELVIAADATRRPHTPPSAVHDFRPDREVEHQVNSIRQIQRRLSRWWRVTRWKMARPPAPTPEQIEAINRTVQRLEVAAAMGRYAAFNELEELANPRLARAQCRAAAAAALRYRQARLLSRDF